MNTEHVDVLIVGAGISGISAAYHLQTYSPSKSFLVLEAREALGGTWDLFRYPGIRSDSDMHTMGFNFSPWKHDKVIGDGATIRNYLQETAEEHGLEKHIRTSCKMESASWSSAEQQWTLSIRNGESLSQITCSFLFMCSGYYNYSHGHEPRFKGAEDFAGQIIHPQQWSEDTDYSNKRVVIIGSGATAITLLPSMAAQAAHVTMLQRSPSYIISWPSSDPIARLLARLLPERLASNVTRWKNSLMQALVYRLTRLFPQRFKTWLIKRVRAELPDDFPIEKHFVPEYMPWDQRLCLVPDGDFFAALRAGRASIATDHIDHFTKNGIQLASGELLEADLIVTATGLDLQVFGGAQISVDGKALDFGKSLFYKGVLVSNVPNFALTFGYLAASWALKADLASRYVSRLLSHMDKHGYQTVTPRPPEDEMSEESFLTFSSGYLQRAQALFPRQGKTGYWFTHGSYPRDFVRLRLRGIADKDLEFRP